MDISPVSTPSKPRAPRATPPRPPSARRRGRRAVTILLSTVITALSALVAPPAFAVVLHDAEGIVWGHPGGSGKKVVSLGDPYPVTAVEAGGSHGLAITYVTGNVLAWGDNQYGQLGDGTLTDRPVSGITIAHLPAATRFIQVAAGTGHSLALGADGRVWAWGHNNHGQLGDGTVTDRHEPVLVDLPDLTRAVAIAAGGDHSLALTSTGHVLSWGDNGFGQLGDGTVTDRHRPVTLDLQARSLTAGIHHSAALLTDGRIFAWGLNVDGQLGDGTHTNRTEPVPMHLPAGVHPTAIDAGGFHTLVLTGAGSVYATGANVNGQLGDGGNRGHRETPVRVQLPAGTHAIAIAGGNAHSLALTSSGKLYGWGANSDGQIDDEGIEHRSPVSISLPVSPGITSISAGGAQSMATTQQFTDVTAANPFVADTTWLLVRDITRGYVDGSYRTQLPVTRRAMAAYLYRMLHRGEDTDSCTGDSPFPDVPAGSYFCTAIDWLAGMAITAGYPDGTFRPTSPVSRQEMAAFLHRLVTHETGSCDARPFPDVPIGNPFCADISWLDAGGITHGYPDGTFRPADPVSRQAMAGYLHRFDDLMHYYGLVVEPLRF